MAPPTDDQTRSTPGFGPSDPPGSFPQQPGPSSFPASGGSELAAPGGPQPYPSEPGQQPFPQQQPPYSQPPPYQQPPYQQPFPADPGQPFQAFQQPAYAYVQARPNHPSATTAMVVGIVSLVGGFFCGLPILAAPFAWYMGGNAVKEIDASGGRYGGRDQARAGQIMGIIGTVLLGLVVLLFVLIIVVATAGSTA